MASLATIVLMVSLTCILESRPSDSSKVLLVSMDGFRYDYFKKAKTPNFDAMKADGVTVPYVTPAFTTLTFPSHYSIATGLYEESHGVVANKFFDPESGETFGFGKHEYKWWKGGEPIWITATKAGLKVGTFFWPGSDTDFNGTRQLYYRSFDSKVGFDERIHAAVDWLGHDEFDVVTLYFDQPDKSGHKYGPNDPRMIPVIERMDSMLGLLRLGLRKAGLTDKVDLIITSDHGMTDVDVHNKVIDLSQYVDSTLLKKSIQSYGAMVHLVPQPNKAKELVEALSKVQHLNVYLKEDMPERLHYSNNPRISRVVAYGDEGWIVAETMAKAARSKSVATHGFDNKLMSMKAIFVASGPSFKSGYLSPTPIESVDIYPLMCNLLNIQPAPNNGSLKRVEPFLDSSNNSGNTKRAEPLSDSSNNAVNAIVVSSSLAFILSLLTFGSIL